MNTRMRRQADSPGKKQGIASSKLGGAVGASHEEPSRFRSRNSLMNALSSLRRVGLVLAVGLVVVLAAGCGMMTAPMSTINTVTDWGRDINRVYAIVTIVCVVVFFFVAVPLCYVLYRFRHKEEDGDRPPKQIRGNHQLEIIWTIVPVLLLVVIFVPTVQVIFRHSVEFSSDEALTVRVTGHQWWWEFEYPEYGVRTANELHPPENTPVRFEITAADVIHSFWVPRFGGKLDALPGVVNIMSLVTPPASGQAGGDYYQGQCAELCGWSHALMRFSAVVHTQEAFEQWVAVHDEPAVAETAKERLGMEYFVTTGCIACHAVSGIDLARGVIGPNLSSFGSRRMVGAEVLPNTHEGVARYLREPQVVKPGNRMVIPELTEEQIDALTAFLRNSTAKQF